MGQAGSLYGVRVGVGSGIGPEGGSGILPILLVVLCAGNMHSTLLLLLALKKWQLGFWSFCILLSIICPNCSRMWLFFFPCFLYFVAWGDICLGTRTIAKGPRSRSQPVSLLQTGVLQYLTSLEIRLKYSFPHEILPSAYHLDLNAAHWTILFGLLLKHYFTLPCVLIDFVHILLLYERQTYWGPGLYLHAASKWLTWYKPCASLVFPLT